MSSFAADPKVRFQLLDFNQAPGSEILNPQPRRSIPITPALIQRAQDLAVLIPHSALPALTVIETASARLLVLSPVAQVLLSVDVTKPALAEDFDIPACASLQKLDLPALQQQFAQCPMNVKEDFEDVFKMAFLPCRDVYRSEDFASGAYAEAKVTRESQTSLVGLMGVAAVAWKKMPWSSSMWGEPQRQQFRDIFVKLRAPTLQRNIDKQFTKFKKFEAVTKACRQSDQAQVVLAPLRAELYQARRHVRQVQEDGETQAQSDRDRIFKLGRYRDVFSVPSLTDSDFRFLSVWLGGWFWRNRGGGPISLGNTFLARYYHAQLPFSTLATAVGGSEIGSALGASYLYRLILKGWSDWMDMGTFTGSIEEDSLGMVWRGQFQVIDAINTLSNHNYEASILKLAASQMGACYNYGAEKLFSAKLYERGVPPYTGFIDGSTSWGEFCTGMVLGLGATEALLYGRAVPLGSVKLNASDF